ncbi:hypothetical protein CPAR01_02889 [Colletotrichum paranaense]|uniref:Uncharacterized protein n=1 Tax=Colletotrichum paranaense TaxID=1914294 RepID=A0ABQ9T0T4_9PEZI|nr:uncharacterized protein CPAR01_02889 [Colletotrichum paranaense]KAK1545387.1 hypothetical protein CPAR01_02889 [Colletotrichum paranaense]
MLFLFTPFFGQSSTTPQHPIAHPRSTLAQSTARNMGSCLLVHTLRTSSNSTLLAHSPHTIRAKIPITPCPSPARIPLTRTRGKDEQLPRHTHLSLPVHFSSFFLMTSHHTSLKPHATATKKSKEKSCTALRCTAHCTLSSTRPPVRSCYPCQSSHACLAPSSRLSRPLQRTPKMRRPPPAVRGLVSLSPPTAHHPSLIGP